MSAVSGKTVLVIDDSETVRATVGDRLERSGYTVASASDGRAAGAVSGGARTKAE